MASEEGVSTVSASHSVEKILRERAEHVQALMESFFINYERQHPGLHKLDEAIRYSALSEGKRFRPVLSLLTAEALEVPFTRVLPYAVAVEFVHTYSLIHDDLPCMDDDDLRRGVPTNHKVFGEDFALLAGDALLTEAFYIISSSYMEEPEAALRAILELSRAAGPRGMVGGQAMDLLAQREKVDEKTLEQIHNLKTGALIRAAVVGSAHLCFALPEKIQDLKTYSESLGLAFQVADDLLDYDAMNPELGSYCALLGVEKTKVFLEELSQRALASLDLWDDKAEPLRGLVKYNLARNL